MDSPIKSRIKEAVKAYDKIASLYSKYKYERLMQYQLNNFISKLPGKKILDAGCGIGRDTEYFLEENYNPIGIDISQGMLDEAKKLVPKAVFKKMDFKKTSFKEKEFDGIWCMASLADIPRDEVNEALKEFNRLLKNKGILFIATKHGQGEEIIKKRKYNDMPRAYVYYGKIELEDLLKKQGFQIQHSIISEDQDKEWLEIFAKKT